MKSDTSWKIAKISYFSDMFANFSGSFQRKFKDSYHYFYLFFELSKCIHTWSMYGFINFIWFDLFVWLNSSCTVKKNWASIKLFSTLAVGRIPFQMSIMRKEEVSRASTNLKRKECKLSRRWNFLRNRQNKERVH